jgi:outer membrane protein assembly factor BamB
MADDRRHDLEIGRFWNDLVRGGRATPGDLDPTLADTIRRLHALAATPTPASARERVRSRLLGQTESTSSEEHVKFVTPALPRLNPNGLTAPGARSGLRPALPAPKAHRHWAVGQLATAALLLVTLVGIYFSFIAPHQPAGAPPIRDVPIFRGNAARTGEMPGPGPAEEPAERWRYAEPIRGSDFYQTSSPVVSDGFVFWCIPGVVIAVDAETGSERWIFETGTFADLWTPAVVGDTLYVGSGDGYLYAVDTTSGMERWRTQVGIMPPSSPVVVDGVLYFGAAAVADGLVYVGDVVGGTLIALDPATGSELWRYAGADPGLYAVDAVSGTVRWHFSTEQPVMATPAVADGVVYVIDLGNRLYAVDAASGTERWSIQVGEPVIRIDFALQVPSSPAVVGDLIYAAGWDGTLVAVDAASGTERWQTKIAFGDYSSPTVTAGVVYIGGSDGTLHAFDAATGQSRWEFGLDGPITSTPVVTGGAVFVVRADGTLFRLD